LITQVSLKNRLTLRDFEEIAFATENFLLEFRKNTNDNKQQQLNRPNRNFSRNQDQNSDEFPRQNRNNSNFRNQNDERNSRNDRVERNDRNERNDRSERNDRGERNDRNDRFGRKDRV